MQYFFPPRRLDFSESRRRSPEEKRRDVRLHVRVYIGRTNVVRDGGVF